MGLDAETEEKENVSIQQWMPVHGTYNEVLDKVEKKPISKAMAGDFPINPQLQAILDKYVKVGDIMEYFLGIKGASKDPQYQYVRDPFYFQMLQLQVQQQQMQQQQQAMAQQQAAGGPQGAPGGAQGGGGGGQEGGGGGEAPEGSQEASGGSPSQPQQTEKQRSAEAEHSTGGADLTRALDQAIGALSKSEKQLPPSARAILAQHKVVVDSFVKGFAEDMEEVNKELLKIAEQHAPKGK